MIEIIPVTKQRIKKFNILGADVSIGFAKYVKQFMKPVAKNGWVRFEKDINYLYDCTEKDAIITHRLILWRFKLEVKTVVQYDYSFA